MKILIINPEAQYGGAERCLETLAIGLKNGPDQAFTPQVLLLSDGPLAITLRANEIPTVIHPLPPFWGRLGESAGVRSLSIWLQLPWQLLILGLWLKNLRQKIKNLAPDLIHSHGIKTHLLLGLLRGKVPVVWHIHDLLAARRLTRPALRFLSRRVVLAITNSDATFEQAQITLACPLRRIHNGVEIPKKRLTSPRHKRVHVGLVATYARWKGHQLYFEAIALLKERKIASEFHFCVVGGAIYRANGSQWDKASLQEEIRSLGVEHEVELLPFEPNLDKLYAPLDIVVNASTQPEPFGLTLAEAMARAKGVILPNHGGATEIARHEREGLHFINNDAVSLADAIERLGGQETLRRRLSRAAQHRIAEHFEASLWVSAIADCYRSLLSKNRTEQNPPVPSRLLVACGFPEDGWHSMKNVALNIFSELESLRSRQWLPFFFGPSLGRKPRIWNRRLDYPSRLPSAEALLLLDHSYADCLVSAGKRYKKTAVVIHDFYFWHSRNWRNFTVRRRILNGIRAATYRIAGSEFVKREAESLGIPINKVILYGVRPDPAFAPLYIERIPGCMVHIGGTGPRKGIEKVLRILLRMPDSFFLVQVGADFSASQKRLIKKYKLGSRIKTTGNVSNDEVARWYHRAHAVLIPSTYEGFGLPAIEARLRETPVVISESVPAWESLKKDSGTVAFPFSRLSDEESKADAWLADQIAIKIVAIPCQSIPFNLTNEFKWPRVAENYAKIIDDLFKSEEKAENQKRRRRY